MHYRDAIDRSIAYIEAHIKEDITVRQVAGHAGYSLFHFCRVFAAIQGTTPGEYIRARRLSLARAALLGGGKIIDVALDYGFETASGFSKAFRKAFGYSPTAYIARMGGWSMEQAWTGMGGNMVEPKIRQMPAFRVAGYGIRTNVASSLMKDIAAYWDTYTGENLESKMYKLLDPPKHGEVGLCVPASADGTATYLLGVIVEDFSKATPDMVTVEVPAARYAVFTTPPVDLTGEQDAQSDPLSIAVKSTWKYIFEEWFPASGCRYDEGKLDFEFYDERCHARPDSTMDIYVPITEAP